MENAADVLIPLGVMTAFVVLVALALYFQYRSKRLVMDVIRMTIERSDTVDPLLIEAIARGPRNDVVDLRRGCMLLAVALALVVFGYSFGLMTSPDLGAAVMGLAAFPGFVGLTFLGLHYGQRSRR